MKIGANPAKGVQVRLSETDNRWFPDIAMPITQAQQLLTDSRGHYAFEHVIPARLSISRIFTLERSSFHVGTGAERTVIVKPGVTTYVDLGGTGRPVVGRFTLACRYQARGGLPLLQSDASSASCPSRPIRRFSRADEREEWLMEWLKTEEGAGLFQRESDSRHQRPTRRHLPHRGRPRRQVSAPRRGPRAQQRHTRVPTVPSWPHSTPKSPSPRCPAAGPTSRWIWARSS